MGLIKICPHQNFKNKVKTQREQPRFDCVCIRCVCALFLNANFHTNGENQKASNFILYVSSSCIGCNCVVPRELLKPFGDLF